MDGRHVQIRRGFTLIEAMVAITILAVVVIGATAYRYASALDCKKASVQASAARSAVCILEAWRADPCSFNPITTLSNSEFTITSSTDAPAILSPFNEFGSGYKIVADGYEFYATLGYQSVANNYSSALKKTYYLTAYNISLEYPDRGQTGSEVLTKTYSITSYEYK